MPTFPPKEEQVYIRSVVFNGFPDPRTGIESKILSMTTVIQSVFKHLCLEFR